MLFMWLIGLFLALVSTVMLTASETHPSYRGSMRIPLDLRCNDGSLVVKGRYQLEVTGQSPGRVLFFRVNGKVKAKVKELVEETSLLQNAAIPVVGTHQLRSTAVKLAPAKDRRFSQTGMARYQEEKHYWSGIMRVYEARQEGIVFFSFLERRKDGQWNRSNFRLSLTEISQ